MKSALLLALSLLAASPALASDWTVDPAKSRLGFSGTQTGAPFQGASAHGGLRSASTPPIRRPAMPR